MPKCPHCGEPVHKGQERCFACHQRLARLKPGRTRSPVNPVPFIAAGAAVLAAVGGLLIFLPRQKQKNRAEHEQAELNRVQDSVRRANIEQGTAGQQDREMAQMNDGFAKLELRFQAVRQQVVGDEPTPEQKKLVDQIGSELVRYRAMVSSMSLAEEAKRSVIADSVRDGQRRVRTLISDLTRAPKNP